MRLAMNLYILLNICLLTTPLLSDQSIRPNAQQLTQFLDDLYRSTSAVGKIEIHVKSSTHDRHLKIRTWTKGTEKALIIIDEPAREAGTATLKVGNNIWNYLPRSG